MTKFIYRIVIIYYLLGTHKNKGIALIFRGRGSNLFFTAKSYQQLQSLPVGDKVSCIKYVTDLSRVWKTLAPQMLPKLHLDL